MSYTTPPEDSEFYSKDDKYCDCCGARYPDDEKFYSHDDYGMICYDCNKQQDNENN